MTRTAQPHGPPRQAIIREVGLRDGLQSIATVVPTAAQARMDSRAYEAGQREIEVGSFVPARLLPQLADTAEVLAFARTLPGLKASVLVPNLKGAERAIDGEAELMLVPLSASHAHSLANLRKTPDEVVADIAAHPRAARCARLEHADRGRHQHRLRLHPAGPRRAGRSAAPGEGRARRRRGPRGPGRHRGLCGPGDGARAVRSCACRWPATGSTAATSTTRAAWAWPTSTPRSRWASPASMPAWAASAAARMRPAPAATWRRKTWRTCWPAWASRPARTSTRCWRCARKVAHWLRRRDPARHAVARRPSQDDVARDGRGSIP